MKKSLIALVALLLVALGLYSQREALLGRMLEKGMDARFAADAAAALGEGLHLALCGAGGPLPAPKASGPCVAVIAGGRLFMVDAGTDGVRNLNRMGYRVGDIEAVFLTHFHSDHIDALGETATVRWAGGGNQEPLPVHGPEGVEQVVAGFNAAYAQDFVYRNAHHGDAVAALSGAGLAARPFRKPAPGELVTVVDDGGLRVEALVVDHSPVDPAVGYRFSYRGRSLLISGDTAQSDNVTRFARDADLLVHDALSPRLVGMMNAAARRQGDAVLTRITGDIPGYHASPVEAAQTAADAGVGHLLYYHIVPPLVLPGQAELFLEGADAIFPDYTIGQDGLTFSLPPDSREIIRVRDGL